MQRSDLPNRRVFIDTSPPDTLPAQIDLSGSDSVEHVHKVLRMKVGDALLAIDPAARQAYLSTIAQTSSKTLQITLLQTVALPQDPTPAGWLGVAMVKEHRWDWLLQKATELGVGRLSPLATERTIVQVSDPIKKQQRWQAIARSAALQSEGLFIPAVDSPRKLTEFLTEVQAVPHKWLLQEDGPEDGDNRLPLRQVIENADRAPWAALIGPEGGWSVAERQQIVNAGFTPVALGQRILKTETAVMALLSAVMLF